jgi:hypothetical protein
MSTIRLGLFQESTDRFALAIHADTAPARVYQEFSARDLRAALVERPEGGASVQLLTLPAEVAAARDLVFDANSRDPDSFVSGGVMALTTFSDWWNMTVLRDSAPGYHVALAFSFYPLRVTFAEGRIVHVAHEDAGLQDGQPAWYMLQPCLAEQAAAIVFPDAPTPADGCASLASRPGVVDYLLGLGDTFSLTDIEQLARNKQLTPSMVVAAARGLRQEDLSWLYCVKLSERAIASAGLLAVSYARAKTRRMAGLRSRTPPNLPDEKLRYWDAQVNRFAHHLAILELCVEYGIGLSSCPMSRAGEAALDDEGDEQSGVQWSVAVAVE